MQFKALLIAFGLAAAANGAALPEPQLEARAVSAPFKIRRFSSITGVTFDETNPATWSNNQYTNIASANEFFNYFEIGLEEAASWTMNTDGTLRGKNPGASGQGLAPRNLQSYSITATPVTFGGVGEVVKVTIGPAPLFEVKFQTQRKDTSGTLNVVDKWVSFTQIGGLIFLGKSADIAAPVRFRAIGYVAPV